MKKILILLIFILLITGCSSNSQEEEENNTIESSEFDKINSNYTTYCSITYDDSGLDDEYRSEKVIGMSFYVIFKYDSLDSDTFYMKEQIKTNFESYDDALKYKEKHRDKFKGWTMNAEKNVDNSGATLDTNVSFKAYANVKENIDYFSQGRLMCSDEPFSN